MWDAFVGLCDLGKFHVKAQLEEALINHRGEG